MLRQPRRKNARRQPHRARGDPRRAVRLLAHQPGQGARIAEGDVGRIAAVAHPLGHQVAAETARRDEHYLAVAQMRRDGLRQPLLRGARQRCEDQFGTVHRFGDVGGGQRQLHVAPALEVRHRQRPAFQHRRECCRIAPPETHAVSGFRRLRRGGVAAVPAAQYRYFHDPRSPVNDRHIICFFI